MVNPNDSALIKTGTPSRAQRSLLAGLVAGFTILFLAIERSGVLTPAQGVWAMGAAWTAACLGAVAACFWAAWRLSGNERRVWLGFGIAAGLSLAGFLAWGALAFFLGHGPEQPNVTDILFLASTVPLGVAIFYLTDFHSPGRFNVRRLCQLGILLVCTYAIVAFPLHEEIESSPSPYFVRGLAVLDLIVMPATAMFGLISLAAYGWLASRKSGLLLVLALVAHAVASMHYGLEILQQGQVGLHIGDLAWFLAFALIFLAAIEAVAEPAPEKRKPVVGARNERRARIVESSVPVLAVTIVLIARMVTTDPIDAREAAFIIVPTFFILALLFSIGEYWSRSIEARLRHGAEGDRDTLSAILDIIPDAIISVDGGGLIRSVNPAVKKLFGYESRDLLNRSMEILIPERFRAHHSGLVSSFVREGGSRLMGSERAPIFGRRKDGGEFPAEASVHRLDLAEETIFIVALRDIAERLRHAEDLRSAREAAEFANRAKSEFLANMSHELRTPLNAIIGFSEMIERRLFGIDVDRYAGYAHDIHTSGKHLLQIINDILDLSKIEAGRQELKEDRVDLRRTIEACQRLVRERASNAGVKLQASLPDRLPRLWSDEVRIRQILINLLSNSIKFTNDGGTITAGAQMEPDGRLALWVADTGIGIKPEDFKKALAPFGQVDSALARRVEGTGLGLPLVKRLAELHQAEFRLESEPGKGTKVTILFPGNRLLWEETATSSS